MREPRNMERRRTQRKNVNIEARIISDGKIYAARTENISREGLNVETDSLNALSTSAQFTPGAICDLTLKTPPGEEISLKCKVVWSFKTAPHGMTEKTGLLIIDPSEKYLEFYNNQQ